MRKLLLVCFLSLLILLAGCLKITNARMIKGVVFTDEYLRGAEVQILDVDGNPILGEPLITDSYGRFSVEIPLETEFPVVILCSFDSTTDTGEKDFLASTVEESFHTELISVNPLTSLFTAYMFKEEIGYAEALQEVREAFNIPDGANLLSQIHPAFETSYFSMHKLVSFIEEQFGGSYKNFVMSVVEAILDGSAFDFGAEPTLDLGISDILKMFLKEIGSSIYDKAKDKAFSWILKSLFGLGDKSEEEIKEILEQIEQINKKLDDISDKLDGIDSEIQDLLQKLDEQYYDIYIRKIDQDYFTPIESCQDRYVYITTLEATHSTDVSIQELMDEIKESKLDQVMLNIKKVIVGGTEETSYKSIFELYITNALNSLRSKKFIDEPTENGQGFYKRCSTDSEIFIDYVNTYINLFKAMTTRQLYALNLLNEYEHHMGSNMAEHHYDNYNSYLAEEVNEFWKWLEIFVTYAIGGESLMIEPSYDPDKAWFYNEADDAALKALGKDSGIVVRLFWNSGETMDVSVDGETPQGIKLAFGFLDKIYTAFINTAGGVKLTLDNQQIQLMGVDEAIEAIKPLGTLNRFSFTYQDKLKSKEPTVSVRRYVFENLANGRYSISRSTNTNVEKTSYTHTLLEGVHKNIVNDQLIALEYLDESNYALSINSENNQVKSLAISVYMPSLRINDKERQMTYGRSHVVADHDYVGVLSYPLNKYMKIEPLYYYYKIWTLFIPSWDSHPFDAPVVDGTDREAKGRYSCRLILTNKGDKAEGDDWGWQTGDVTRTHPVWLRATDQLSAACLAPTDLSAYYSIAKKNDQYKMPSTTFCLYLNADTSFWDLNVVPSGINILGTLFGGDGLFYGEVVVLRNISFSRYVSYSEVNRGPDYSNYNLCTLTLSDIYDMKNWWIFLR